MASILEPSKLCPPLALAWSHSKTSSVRPGSGTLRAGRLALRPRYWQIRDSQQQSKHCNAAGNCNHLSLNSPPARERRRRGDHLDRRAIDSTNRSGILVAECDRSRSQSRGPGAGTQRPELTSFADGIPSRLLASASFILEDLKPSIVGIGNSSVCLIGSKTGVDGDALLHRSFSSNCNLRNLVSAPVACEFFKSLYGWGDPDSRLTVMRVCNVWLCSASTPISTNRRALTGTNRDQDIAGRHRNLGDAAVPTCPASISRCAHSNVVRTHSSAGHLRCRHSIDVTPPSTVTIKRIPVRQPEGNLSLDLVARSPDQNRPLVLWAKPAAVESRRLHHLWRRARREIEYRRNRIAIRNARRQGSITTATLTAYFKTTRRSETRSDFDVAGDYSISNGLHFRGAVLSRDPTCITRQFGQVSVNASLSARHQGWNSRSQSPWI